MAGRKKVGEAKQACPLKGIPLLVTVKEAGGLSVSGFTVSVLEAGVPDKVAAQGVVDPRGRASLKSLMPGEFEVRALPPTSLRGFFDAPAVEITIPRRSKGEVSELEVTARRKKVGAGLGAPSAQVWVMPASAKRQAPYVEATFTDEDPDLPFRGRVRLRRTEEVNVYLDADCASPLAFDRSNEANVPLGLLKQEQPLRLYLQGRHPGRAGLSLRVVPDDAQKPFIETDPAAELEFEVKEANVVRGLVDVQLPVVLVEPGLSARLPPGEESIATSPTQVQLRIEQSGQDVPFEGGATFTCSSDHVAFFSDEALTRPFELSEKGEAKVAPEDLSDGKAFVLWARADASGLARLSLVPDPVEKEGLWVDEQEPVDVALVAIQCEVTRWEDGPTPWEIPLDRDELARRGRFLHVQDAKANHARARLRLKKLNVGHWPTTARDLTLVVSLEGQSGGVKLYGVEKGGKALKLPYAVPRSALLSDDVSLWVEGTEDSTSARSLVVDVGLGREKSPDAPLLRNAFWSKFTVVTLSEVKPPSEFDAPTDAYDKGELRHVINLEADPAGRKIDAMAKLSQALAGVPVGFALLPHKKNRTAANSGVDVPSKWTFDATLEKSDATKGVRPHVDTDQDGVAMLKGSLQVSRIAGDRFSLAAFLIDDAPLGHYGTGKRYTRLPLTSQPIQVWTKVWYQLTHNDATNVPDPDLAVQAYAQVRSELIASARKRFKKADAPAGTFYPRWMMRPGKGDDPVAVIGGHNKDAFMAMRVDDPKEPRKAHVVVCDEQWDPGGRSSRFTVTFPAGEDRLRLALPESVLKPPLGGGALIGKSEWRQGKDKKGAINDAWLEVPKDRTETNVVDLVLPAGVKSTAGREITVKFKVETASGPYLGESDGVNILAVYDPKEVADFSDTIAHEIGHSLNQTPRTGAQPPNAPAHPQQVDHGQGNHCTDTACVMYESGPEPAASHRFCDVCRPYLIAEDFSKWS